MDEITAILDSSRPVTDVISDLKNKSVDVPEWSKLLKDYEPTKHKIVDDKETRKDKVRSDGTIERASRIYIGLEKLLTKRTTEFAFAIPVRRVYHNTDDNEKRQQIAKAIEAIYKYARIDSENIKRGNAYFASCEIFTIWYAVEKPNSLYGFKSKYKLKCKTYSPMDGVKLYPLFDEMDDMLAMSFEYKKKIKDKEVTFFETYTSDKHFKWKQQDGDWESIIEPEKITLFLGKIPGAYAYRHEPIYHGLSHIREEVEYTLSRNSDVIAYNSAPVLKVTGELVGDEDKGESRRLFRLKNGGDVSYVSWSQAIEALKYHVETLLKLFFMQGQMPDLSFENMKALGNIGFDARQMMLSDAHLKIGDESGAWIEFFERECSVIKEFLKFMNTDWKDEIDNVEVEHVITPFIQNDETAMTDRLIKQNGGKAIKSQLETIKEAGAKDAEATLKQIQKEEQASRQARMNSLFEGAE
ncbi:phage portal protein [uncultured Parabacteroides sp.]|uniref:phage portal protein n=1 Tax=uncultured Parabacteroides sp. TaxID=512312 RepID=UPI0026319A2D|nr:phage portal protein [uncultured Parabacteroides sp.]